MVPPFYKQYFPSRETFNIFGEDVGQFYNVPGKTFQFLNPPSFRFAACAVLYLANGRAGGPVQKQAGGDVGAGSADQERSIARHEEAPGDLDGVHFANDRYRGDGRSQDSATADEQTEHFHRSNNLEFLLWNRLVEIWSLEVECLRLLSRWRGVICT